MWERLTNSIAYEATYTEDCRLRWTRTTNTSHNRHTYTIAKCSTY